LMNEPSTTKSALKCSRCGSSDVLIVRRYSGEALCRRCLRNSLLVRIRRAISRYKLLSRNDDIIFLRSGLKRDDLLWDLFSEIESEFPVSIREEKLPPHTDLWEAILVLLKEEEGIDNGKVILPLLLDDAVGLLLRFIFTGSPSLLVLRGRILLALREVPGYISPFVEVPVEELLALSESRESSREFENVYLRLVWKLEEENPGMRFNVLRVSERGDFLKSIGIVFR